MSPLRCELLEQTIMWSPNQLEQVVTITSCVCLIKDAGVRCGRTVLAVLPRAFGRRRLGQVMLGVKPEAPSNRRRSSVGTACGCRRRTSRPVGPTRPR